MVITINRNATATDLESRVREMTGADLRLCFQCKKCSAGCPVADHAAAPPAELIRRMLMGQGEELLQSDLVWVCSSCGTCQARCPMGIDLPVVMDALKTLAARRAGPPPQGNTPLFNRGFLSMVRAFGRAYDLGALMIHKIGTRAWTADADKIPVMLSKGKIAILPPRGGDKATVRRIMKKTRDGKVNVQ